MFVVYSVNGNGGEESGRVVVVNGHHLGDDAVAAYGDVEGQRDRVTTLGTGATKRMVDDAAQTFLHLVVAEAFGCQDFILFGVCLKGQAALGARCGQIICWSRPRDPKETTHHTDRHTIHTPSLLHRA